MVAPVQQTNAQIPILQIIQEGIKKVIVAVDLEIQRIQTKTIWLQNTQKVLENEMSQLKLTDITSWVQKQKDLYANYYQELKEVKSAIVYYQKVKEIMNEQVQLVNTYKQAFALFQQDKNFTPDEIDYMYKIYSGILDESVKNLDQIFIVINAFSTQMTDEQRLAIIDKAASQIDQNYSDLKEFNAQNIQISLQRAKEYNDVDVVKQLYGIQ
ncbi:MAG: conjugal transfer protein TraI [Chitinophagaceae bacterium]